MVQTTSVDTRTAFRFRWAVLSMNFLVLGLNYADRAAIGVAAPLIIAEYGFSKTTWGWIAAIFSIGYAPFCFVGGWTSDKFGPRKVMAIAVGWWSLFTALTGAGFGFVSFMIIRFFFGFGEGPQASVTAKTMSNWFPQRRLATALGLSQCSTPLGGAVGTPIVVALINAFNGNWRAPFFILGVIGVFFMIGWIVVVRDRPEAHPWVRQAEVQEMADDRSQHEEDTAEVEHSASGLWSYLRMPLVITTASCYFGYTWVLFTFLTWFPDFLHDVHGLDLSQIAFTGAIPWVCGFIGLGLGGIFTDNLGRRFGVFEARKWVSVISLLLVAVTFAFVGVVKSTGSAVTLMAITVFILYVVGAQFFAIIGPVVPLVRFGSVSGFIHFVANIAGIIAPIVLGAIVDHTGSWVLSFVVSGVVVAIPPICLAIFGKRSPNDRGSAGRTRKVVAER